MAQRNKPQKRLVLGGYEVFADPVQGPFEGFANDRGNYKVDPETPYLVEMRAWFPDRAMAREFLAQFADKKVR